jgi:hypothetical protein
MTRAALEHLLRAAAAITNERDFVVIGSQAILGQYPSAPDALLVSIEADLYPRDAPEKSDLIDAAIGELSTFHETFGYYAHGVDETTATLPLGWTGRLIPLRTENTGGATGWCLEVHDLAAAKLVAGRERDVHFIRTLIDEQLADAATLTDRLRQLPLGPERIEALQARLRQLSDRR